MEPERFALFKARFRILVLKNPKAEKRHQRVNAVCLELNLIGRGSMVGSALDDLAGLVFDSLKHEFNNLVPAPHLDPEPELLQVFEKQLAETQEGEIVLRRCFLNLEATLTSVGKPSALVQGKLPRQARNAVFEDCLV